MSRSTIPKSMQSYFEGRTLSGLHQEIQEVYAADKKPWIIGYSGGKDSTTVLQLVWNALAELPQERRFKPVHVVSSDTLVETPVIVDFIDQTLNRLNEAAERKGMPFSAEKVRPPIRRSFWVNLIGRGYPAPQHQFRWCTDRLKIEPTTQFILEKISKYGEVVLVLGVRHQESATRSQVMSLHRIHGSLLSRHTQLPRAYVYAPIKDFTTDDVWFYLLQNPSPWGSNNRDLVALYQNAQGECPLVIDDTTPPCGNSRFGCWVCTLVVRDKSMEALINSGEEWMLPLLQIRDFLRATQDPERKHIYRDFKRRQGFVSFKTNNPEEISRGPYYLSVRKDILKKVLEAQMQIAKEMPDRAIVLILPEELHEIRRIWRSEEGDWEDSVPRMYREVMHSDLIWIRDDFSFTEREKTRLEEISRKYKLPPQLFVKLLTAELECQGMSHRSSIYDKIDHIFSEDWRTEQEVTEEARKRRIVQARLVESGSHDS